MRELTSEADVAALLREPTAILLKHGATCPISAAARDELARFALLRPDVPLFGLEVTANRDLSEAVARRLHVRHESPQAFVLRDGAPAWHAQHFDITAASLQQAIG